MATTRAVACCISTARYRGPLRLCGGLLIVALALGPAGSAADDFHALMDGVIARMHGAMHVASSGDPDRDFARMMVPHHQGAIDTALLELRFGKDERLRRLAQGIIVEQEQEIEVMRSILQAGR